MLNIFKLNFQTTGVQFALTIFYAFIMNVAQKAKRTCVWSFCPRFSACFLGWLVVWLKQTQQWCLLFPENISVIRARFCLFTSLFSDLWLQCKDTVKQSWASWPALRSLIHSTFGMWNYEKIRWSRKDIGIDIRGWHQWNGNGSPIWTSSNLCSAAHAHMNREEQELLSALE